MKKIYIPFLIAGLFCYGCNTSTNPSETKATADSLNQNASDTVSANTVPAKPLDEIGLELLQKEQFGAIKIGLTAVKTTEALGTPEKKGKQEEWEADGETHQLWEYKSKGLSLDMIGKEEQVISSIDITAPSTLKTTKNIGIGSTKEEVEAAYADAIDKSNPESTDIVAGTIYGGIIFRMENGKVTGIFAGAAAE